MASVHTVTFCGMEGAQPEEPLAFVARPSSQGPNKGMPVLHAGPLARSAVRSDLREALLGLQCCAPLAEAALYSAVEYMVVEQDGQSVWDGMKKVSEGGVGGTGGLWQGVGRVYVPQH